MKVSTSPARACKKRLEIFAVKKLTITCDTKTNVVCGKWTPFTGCTYTPANTANYNNSDDSAMAGSFFLFVATSIKRNLFMTKNIYRTTVI